MLTKAAPGKCWILGNNTESARAMEMQNAIFTFSGIAACDRFYRKLSGKIEKKIQMLKSERQKLPGCMWNIPGYTLAEGKGRVDTQDNTAKGKMLNRGVLKGLWISCWMRTNYTDHTSAKTKMYGIIFWKLSVYYARIELCFNLLILYLRCHLITNSAC